MKQDTIRLKHEKRYIHVVQDTFLPLYTLDTFWMNPSVLPVVYVLIG